MDNFFLLIYSNFLAFSIWNKEDLSIMPFLIKNEGILHIVSFFTLLMRSVVKSPNSSVWFLSLWIENEEARQFIPVISYLYQSGIKNVIS